MIRESCCFSMCNERKKEEAQDKIAALVRSSACCCIGQEIFLFQIAFRV